MANSSHHFRFGLGALFVGMTALAILFAFVMIAPGELSHLVLGLFWIVAMSVLLIGIVFGQGDRRAFCIGAFVVALSVFTDLGGRFMHGVHFILADVTPSGRSVSQWLDFTVLAIFAVVNGLVCVRARSFFED